MSAFFILFFFFSLSFAAETLDTIEVSASKRIEDYTFSQTENLSKEELETQPLPLVSHVLERVPGLVSSQNGGPGGRTTFFIRGTEARHVSFTLDGLKLNDPTNTDRQFDAAFLSLTSVEEIRVHKGPQAVLFGSDAMGGHIEMLSRKGSDKPEKKLTLSGGSFGTVGASYRQDWKKGTLSVVRQHTDGISRYNEKRFDATERDGSDITQLTSSSRHEISPQLKTDLLASFIEGRNELDVTSDNSDERSRNHQYLLQQKTSYSIDKNSAISLRNGLNRNDRRIKNLTRGNLDFTGNLFQNELLWERGEKDARILTGISNEKETYDLSGTKSFDLNSFFIQGLLTEGDFSFHGGLRGDHHSRYGNFVTGSTGLEMRSYTGTWGFQYSRGYKAPSLYQLHDPVLGNKELNPESNQSYEASWKKKFSKLELANVFFHNRLSNLVTFTGSGFRNQNRFISEGFEPSIKWTDDSFEVRGSFTHQQIREEEEPVLRRPYNMAQLSGTVFPTENSELFAKGRWFDSRKDFDFVGGIAKLNSFETFDLGGNYRWGKQTISLQLVNILGREYEEIFGFSVMPRSLFGSYSLTF
ncbi:MAG: TonB-dependent receptor [Bdellovibrionota bacterium]